jgi:hypothetical protein
MGAKTFCISVFILSLGPGLWGQVQVENTKNLKYSREEVMLAYDITRRHVTEELFPNRRGALPEFPVVLKLGCTDSASGEDFVDTSRRAESSKSVVCLREWDLVKFTSGLLIIAQSRLIPDVKRHELVADIVHRVQLSEPVSVADIQNKR